MIGTSFRLPRGGVIGGTCERVEGDWQPTYPVLIEFSTLADARGWNNSVEYVCVKPLRESSSACHAVCRKTAEPNELVK